MAGILLLVVLLLALLGTPGSSHPSTPRAQPGCGAPPASLARGIMCP